MKEMLEKGMFERVGGRKIGKWVKKIIIHWGYCN